MNDRDEIAVAECWNHRVSVFSSDGAHLRSFGKRGKNNGELNAPSGIAFDSLGNIAVADCNNHRVQVFDRNGKFLRKFGEYGILDLKSITKILNTWTNKISHYSGSSLETLGALLLQMRL